MTDLLQQPPQSTTSRRQTLVEIALIFAVFFMQGAWPVPDVNEPHYLGQAIHYWNPDWLRGDFFIKSPNTHRVFCFTFGWLSLWLPPVALAWTGRILTWGLLAWAWRRLSIAVVPRPWYAILTAALFVCLMDRCHMAGEWVIGGVEAKGFAYVFVFLGLEALVRNRWNRAFLLLGIASAFHVLVGGWAAVAVGIAWLWLKTRGLTASRFPKPTCCNTWASLPALRSLWPGIVGGLLLAMPELIPPLALDWGVDAQTAALAHQIYVFQRLPHHLFLGGVRPEFILRLGLVWCVWLLLGRLSSRSCRRGLRHCNDGALENDQHASLLRLRAFVAGAVIITLMGVAINGLVYLDRAIAASLLRYYWFRMTDVALPLGVVLEGAALLALWCRRPAGRCGLALAILLAAFHVGDRAIDRIAPLPPRSHKMASFKDWRDACAWAANPQNVPPGARFLTPRLSHTFGWYSGHSEVATWKNVPQDAVDIIEWWRRIQEIYMTGKPPPEPRWYPSLADLGAERLRQLGTEYKADYLITEATGPPLKLEQVYRNDTYVIYRLR